MQAVRSAEPFCDSPCGMSPCGASAGALAGYLWKNRDLQRSTEQLIYIAGIHVPQIVPICSSISSTTNSDHFCNI